MKGKTEMRKSLPHEGEEKRFVAFRVYFYLCEMPMRIPSMFLPSSFSGKRPILSFTCERERENEIEKERNACSIDNQRCSCTFSRLLSKLESFKVFSLYFHFRFFQVLQ